MKTERQHHESQLIRELIREVSEVGKHLKEKHHLSYAFSPSARTDKETYHHNMRLITVIHDLLNECCINIKTRGYTYIKEALCIITDHGTYDVCLSTDIYPYIASKHGVSDIGRIEHNIRNSIDAAYKMYLSRDDIHSPLMERFDSRPTAKVFLLHLKDEIDRRLWNEAPAY